MGKKFQHDGKRKSSKAVKIPPRQKRSVGDCGTTGVAKGNDFGKNVEAASEPVTVSPVVAEIKAGHLRVRSLFTCSITPIFKHKVKRAQENISIMGKGKKTKKTATDPNERVIADNRKARHEYHVLESLECGIVLVGSEVKSLRNGTVALSEAYAKVRNNEVWLVNCDIPEYVEANRFNHKPRRDRKLLLKQREIKKFAMRAYEKGLTLVPLKMYFKEGKAKVLIGLCKGKQEFDKRAAQKKAESDRGLRLSLMHRSRKG